jgi:regulator of sirC expression with transglutaminase-like and TPR domain
MYSPVRENKTVRDNPAVHSVLLSLFACLFLLSSTPSVARAAVPANGDARHLQGIPERIATLPDEEVRLLPTLHEAAGEGIRKLTGRSTDAVFIVKEVNRIAWRVSASLVGAREPRRVVAAINRELFTEEGFAYDPAPGDPENYLLDRVLARKRGNCLGLTFLFLALGERLEIPLRGAYVPGHCFARYEGYGIRFNIETGEKGAERSDAWYAGTFKVGIGHPYLRTLGKREMIGVYLKSLGAALSRKGMDEEALRLYREAARFSPGLPDVYYNAGVSYQKLGKSDEAIAQYRKALSLDPDMAAARGNLGATLCSCGRTEDGIREYLKALEINPDNFKARSGLAKAYFSQGAYREAILHCDRAMEQGCSFDPSMLQVLERYRGSGGIPPRR